ncbi:General secretion pathway protein H [Pseudoalteromonas luteoviolacea B = ATCC 29581]|nr:General secretion pathway protein H [Pseudoalteromonas luteoviolacea B = ATCC 29581]
MVLVIIAFATQLVVYSLDDDHEEALAKHALRLHTTINMASEFAVLNQVELGMMLEKQTLEFLVYDGENWITLEGEDMFEPIELGEAYRLTLNLDDLTWSQDNLLEQANWREILSAGDESLLEQKKRKIPQVLLLSSGEMSAFQLQLEADGFVEPIYFIDGEYVAPAKLRKEPEDE